MLLYTTFCIYKGWKCRGGGIGGNINTICFFIVTPGRLPRSSSALPTTRKRRRATQKQKKPNIITNPANAYSLKTLPLSAMPDPDMAQGRGSRAVGALYGLAVRMAQLRLTPFEAEMRLRSPP